QFTPRPQRLTSDSAVFEIALAPRQAVLHYIAVACEREDARHHFLLFERARADARAQFDSQVAEFCAIETGNGQFDALVKRATSDLHMMTTVLPTGLYPYAGVPWFNTPFGRDGLITAPGVPLAQSRTRARRSGVPRTDAGDLHCSAAGRRAGKD